MSPVSNFPLGNLSSPTWCLEKSRTANVKENMQFTKSEKFSTLYWTVLGFHKLLITYPVWSCRELAWCENQVDLLLAGSRSSGGWGGIFKWRPSALPPPPSPPPAPAPACHNGSQSWARPLLPSHYHTLSSRVNNLILIPILVHLLLPHPCPDPNLISTRSWIDSFWTFGDLTGQLDLNWAQSVDRPLETSGNGWNLLNIHYGEVSPLDLLSIER